MTLARLDHFGGQCARVAHALQVFSANIQVDLSVTATGAQNALASALVLWPRPHPVRTQAVVIFNSSVWFQRCNFFAFKGNNTADQTTDRLSREASLSWRLHCHVPKSKSERGSAGTRTPAQEKAARALTHDIIMSIDHDNTIVAYTDGASRGNPGPCGAGAIVTYPRWIAARGSKHTEELSAGLGRGTNQLGELWAIGMVLEDLATKALAGYDPPAHGTILTDSKYAKGCLGEGWDAKGANAPLVEGLALLEASPVSWTIDWVPGHADVAGNDAADAAAVRGAERSAASRGLIGLEHRRVNNNYLP